MRVMNSLFHKHATPYCGPAVYCVREPTPVVHARCVRSRNKAQRAQQCRAEAGVSHKSEFNIHACYFAVLYRPCVLVACPCSGTHEHHSRKLDQCSRNWGAGKCLTCDIDKATVHECDGCHTSLRATWSRCTAFTTHISDHLCIITGSLQQFHENRLDCHCFPKLAMFLRLYNRSVQHIRQLLASLAA